MYANREQVPLRDATCIVLQERLLLIIHQGFLCVAVGEEITESSVLQYIQQRKALGYMPNGADDELRNNTSCYRSKYGDFNHT